MIVLQERRCMICLLLPPCQEEMMRPFFSSEAEAWVMRCKEEGRDRQVCR